MFDDLREALREVLRRGGTASERRPLLAEMRETLVRARLGLDELRASVGQTRERLEAQRQELETIRRRKQLAVNIHDAETVAVAERFERQCAEREALLARKLEVETAELAHTEREVAAMSAEYGAALAGAQPPGAAAAGGATPGDVREAARDLDDALAGTDRARRRAAAAARAEEQLAELKRRMGKG